MRHRMAGDEVRSRCPGRQQGIDREQHQYLPGQAPCDRGLKGQNGRRYDFKPQVKAKCKGKSAQGGGKRKQR